MFIGLLILGKDAVYYPVRLEYAGNPTSQDAEDKVPDDNNNNKSYNTEVQFSTSSHNGYELPPFPNPETRLTTQV